MAEPFHRSLIRALRSPRTAAVSLLSFSSGLPLGLVWIAVPDWMRDSGFDIRVVGLFTLAQAPWAFKVFWSPWMDRFHPPGLDRRRGWIVVSQAALMAGILGLAACGSMPVSPWPVLWITLAVAFAAASQDIVLDAYAVEVLRPDEQAVAVGARTALYRAAMFVAGGLAITLAASIGWSRVHGGLALLLLPMVALALFAPNPESPPRAPATIRHAIWLPLMEILSRRRAWSVLAFVVCYKLSDNLAQSLLRPFLIDMGYDAVDRGVSLATIGMAGTLAGTFVGGALTQVTGLSRSLWIFGLLQVFSNLGYVLIAHVGVHRPLMIGAMGFESFTSGLGTGAFSVFLLRITRRSFSASQYALLSSLFALPRILSGVAAGWTVHALGWPAFFWITMLAGVPGLWLLAHFAPWGEEIRAAEDEPESEDLAPPASLPWGRAAGGFLAGVAIASAAAVALRVQQEGAGFWRLVPREPRDWIQAAAVAGAGVVGALVSVAWSEIRLRRARRRSPPGA